MEVKQGELPLIGEIGPPKNVAQELVERCQTAEEAFAETWANRRIKGMTNKRACELLGIKSQPTFSQMLQGKRNLPLSKVNRFCFICGNRLLRQWLDAEEAEDTVLYEVQKRLAEAG